MYPADLRPRDWLGYYATHCDTLELKRAFPYSNDLEGHAWTKARRLRRLLRSA